MPQREFWSQRHPVEVRWNYRYDPTGAPPSSSLAMGVYDQEGRSMAWLGCPVPMESVQESVTAALVAGWDAYLLGSPGDGPHALRRALAAFRTVPAPYQLRR